MLAPAGLSVGALLFLLLFMLLTGLFPRLVAMENDEARMTNDECWRAPRCRRALYLGHDGVSLHIIQHKAAGSRFYCRSDFKNDLLAPCNRSSNRLVQSQSQQAHGSVPFSCRQLRRECASETLTGARGVRIHAGPPSYYIGTRRQQWNRDRARRYRSP
jgi:hypothetical protein